MAIAYEGYSDIDATAGNDSDTNVTIPAGATIGIVTHAMYDFSSTNYVASVTVDGQSVSIIQQVDRSVAGNSIFLGTVTGFSTGSSKTVSWTYNIDGSIDQSGHIYITWLSGANTTLVANDYDQVNASTATTTLNNTATDQYAVVLASASGVGIGLNQPTGSTRNWIIENTVVNSQSVGLAYYTFSTTGSKDYTASGNSPGVSTSGALLEPATAASKTVKLMLTERDGTRRQSLTSLKWAWFDQTAPNSFVTPTDTGTVETTDTNGVIEVTLTGTSLVAGQYGCLALSTSDDVDLGLYKLRVR